MNVQIAINRFLGNRLIFRAVCIVLAGMLALSTYMSSTLTWSSLNNSAINAFYGDDGGNGFIIRKSFGDPQPPAEELDNIFAFLLDIPSMAGGLAEYNIMDSSDGSLVTEGLPVKPTGDINDPGSYVFLKAGQYAEFPDMPSGTWYRVREIPSLGFETDSTGTSGHVFKNGPSVADFTNTYHSGIAGGSLEIIKSLTPNAEVAPDFEFDVKFELNGNGYNGLVKAAFDGGDPIDFRSPGDVSLPAGGSVRFTNLPPGVKYTVTERDYSEDNYYPLAGSFTGHIPFGVEPVILNASNCFIDNNTAGNGELSITKRLTGATDGVGEGFKFVVTIEESEYPWLLAHGGLSEANENDSYDADSQNGVANDGGNSNNSNTGETPRSDPAGGLNEPGGNSETTHSDPASDLDELDASDETASLDETGHEAGSPESSNSETAQKSGTEGENAENALIGGPPKSGSTNSPSDPVVESEAPEASEPQTEPESGSEVFMDNAVETFHANLPLEGYESVTLPSPSLDMGASDAEGLDTDASDIEALDTDASGTEVLNNADASGTESINNMDASSTESLNNMDAPGTESINNTDASVIEAFGNTEDLEMDASNMEDFYQVVANNLQDNLKFTSAKGVAKSSFDRVEGNNCYFTLYPGETALFSGIPQGMKYTVTELVDELPVGYTTTHETVSGVVIGQRTAEVEFVNHKPEGGVKLAVTKKTVNAPEEEKDKSFKIWLYIDGVKQEPSIELKNDASYTIDIPLGAHYEIVEEDYAGSGYWTYVEHASGIHYANKDVSATVMNYFMDNVPTPTPISPNEFPTNTPELGTLTHTPVPGTLTHTPVPGTLTHTPVPGTLTHTPVPGTLTHTPTPGALTHTPGPGTLTLTPGTGTPIRPTSPPTILTPVNPPPSGGGSNPPYVPPYNPAQPPGVVMQPPAGAPPSSNVSPGPGGLGTPTPFVPNWDDPGSSTPDYPYIYSTPTMMEQVPSPVDEYTPIPVGPPSTGPLTSDSSNPAPWLAVMVLSAVLLRFMLSNKSRLLGR